MEQRESVESGLRNVALGNQAVAAVERRFDYALFFEDVGKCPVRHQRGKSVTLTDIVRKPWTHECRVSDVHFVHVTGVVLAPDNRNVRVRRGMHLVEDFLHGARDHLRSRYAFMRPEHIFSGVVAVDVSRDEIYRDVRGGAVLEELRNPGGLRGRRSADSELRIHLFDGCRGSVVKLEVSRLLRIAGPEVNIRLVPYFEIPLGHFRDTVAVDKV